MARVLVTDGDSAAALSIVRSLGRAGHHVDVCETHPRPTAGRSRYCRRVLVCPDPGRARDAFCDFLAAQDHDLLIPSTDFSVVPLLDARDRMRAVVAMPASDAVRITLSKTATTRHAEASGVPVPPWWTTPADARLPVVVKPDVSKVWTPAGVYSLSVRHARTPDELDAALLDLRRAGDVLIQGFVPGDIVALAVLYDRGERRSVFQYRRLHQVPPSGGASSYRMSEEVDPKLADYADRFLGALGWTGVAMVEFKVEGEAAWLIEINGRFWGSLALPVAAGADFPAWLADLHLEGRQGFPDWRRGVRCRSFAKEVEWFKHVAKDPAHRPPVGEIVGDTARMLDPRERWDELSIDDPVPGLAVAAGTFGRLAGGVSRTLRKRLMPAQMEARRRLRPWRGARSVLFVCDGNICRSVYAAELLRARRPELEITSAGLDAHPGRPAHSETLARIAARGLPPPARGARRLTRELVEAHDAVFVMTWEHVMRVRRDFGGHPGLGMLACLAREGDLQVADPDGRDAAFFDRIFSRIEECVEAYDDEGDATRR